MSQPFLIPAALAPARLYLPFPLALTRAGLTGFPSPAQDYAGPALDLNELVVKRPSSTYFTIVDGDSMVEFGIQPGDVLAVDSSLTPRFGQDIVACVDGEIVVKRFQCRHGMPYLCSGNPNYPPIAVATCDCQVLGVVTHVIRSCV